MRHDVLHRVHDFRYAGLVIGTQQRRAVGRDERLAHVMQHLRELGRLQRQSRHTLEGDFPAVIRLDDLRLDIRPGRIRRRIDMGDEAHRRHLLVHIGRNAAHHIPVLVERDLHAHPLQFIPQHPQQIPLLLGGRLALRLLVRLRVHRHVP